MTKSGMGMLLGGLGIDPEQIAVVVKDFQENVPKFIGAFNQRLSVLEIQMARLVQLAEEAEMRRLSTLAPTRGLTGGENTTGEFQHGGSDGNGTSGNDHHT